VAVSDTSGMRRGVQVVVFGLALQVSKYQWGAQSSTIGNKLG
jgi:hypothetical protein